MHSYGELEEILHPKQWGGLGLRATRDLNQASTMKAGWNLISSKDDMWADVIRTKYKCG